MDRCNPSSVHFPWCSVAKIMAMVCGLASSSRGEAPLAAELHPLIVSAQDSPNAVAPYRFDGAAYSESTRHLPIGVFDSGIGGLTVLEAIYALDAFNNETLAPQADGIPDFAGEQFIYLGDQANMPYGNYASSGKEAFLRELILKDAIFLLGKRYWPDRAASTPRWDKPPVKAIVIACNTATAYGIDDVRNAIRIWKIPVIVVGVVEAGARGVAESIAPSDEARGVAILATVGTCSSMAYPKAIQSTVGLAGKRIPQIIQQGSVGLAGAIEGDPSFIQSEPPFNESRVYQGPSAQSVTARLDAQLAPQYNFDRLGLLGQFDQPESWRLNSISNYARYDVVSLVEKYRSEGGKVPIDTVVLGCTHFPLVESEIANAFAELRNFADNAHPPYRHLIAEKIRMVNPAELTAKELFRELAKARLRRDDRLSDKPASDQFYLSVPNPTDPSVRLTANGDLDREYKYQRMPGKLQVEDTRVVPLTPSELSTSSLQLIQKRLPQVWSRLSLVAAPAVEASSDSPSVSSPAANEQSRSLQVPESVLPHWDIEYHQIGSRKLLADLFVPNRAARSLPAVVLVHGGGWLHGDKTRFRSLALRLAEQGYVVAAIEYRLGNEAKFPAAIQDCFAAVRFLRTYAEKYRIDPQRIAAVGGSAGGHLVGLMATGAEFDSLLPSSPSSVSARIQCAVVMAGPMQMATGSVAERSHSGMKSNAIDWIGKSIDEAPEKYQLADAYEKISSDDCPILFITGSLDHPERDLPSLEKLRSVGVPARQIVHEGAKHGHWNQANWIDRVALDIDTFLKEHL